MSEHTPGPWWVERKRVSHTDLWLTTIVADDPDASPGSGYKTVPGHLAIAGNNPREEADARLIAAAPDLLEAAKRIASAIESEPECECGSCRSLLALQAAIAKAEGRS